MSFKLITVFALLATAYAEFLNGQTLIYQSSPLIQQVPVIQQIPSGLPIYYSQPIIQKQESQDYNTNPQYSFAYNVQDRVTGDNKNQQESRRGDVVKGQYSLTEADGTRRIVDYTADPINGFNAVVSREGNSQQSSTVGIQNSRNFHNSKNSQYAQNSQNSQNSNNQQNTQYASSSEYSQNTQNSNNQQNNNY